MQVGNAYDTRAGFKGPRSLIEVEGRYSPFSHQRTIFHIQKKWPRLSVVEHGLISHINGCTVAIILTCVGAGVSEHVISITSCPGMIEMNRVLLKMEPIK